MKEREKENKIGILIVKKRKGKERNGKKKEVRIGAQRKT